LDLRYEIGLICSAKYSSNFDIRQTANPQHAAQ